MKKVTLKKLAMVLTIGILLAFSTTVIPSAQASEAVEAAKVTVDFYVPVAGKYDVYFDAYQKSASGGLMTVSVGDEIAGNYDFYAEETVTPESEKLENAVHLNAGVNTITFTCAEDRQSSYENMYFVGFSFKPSAEPDYEQGDINGDGKINTRDVTTLR